MVQYFVYINPALLKAIVPRILEMPLTTFKGNAEIKSVEQIQPVVWYRLCVCLYPLLATVGAFTPYRIATPFAPLVAPTIALKCSVDAV